MTSRFFLSGHFGSQEHAKGSSVGESLQKSDEKVTEHSHCVAMRQVNDSKQKPSGESVAHSLCVERVGCSDEEPSRMGKRTVRKARAETDQAYTNAEIAGLVHEFCRQSASCQERRSESVSGAHGCDAESLVLNVKPMRSGFSQERVYLPLF